jgi:hypothetical protein
MPSSVWAKYVEIFSYAMWLQLHGEITWGSKFSEDGRCVFQAYARRLKDTVGGVHAPLVIDC